MGILKRNTFLCAFVLMVAAVVMLALGGCSGASRTTTTKTLPNGTVLTVDERPYDFFESGNLRMYYESDSKRVESHERNVSKKIDAVNGMLAQPASTPEARAWQQAAGLMAVANIKDSAPIVGQTPKTMADVVSTNGNLFYQIGRDLVTGISGSSGSGGDSSATDQGSSVNLANSDHNTIVVTTKPSLSGSNFYPSTTPTSTVTLDFNSGDQAQQGSGSFTHDQSVTTTQTGDSALAAK